MKIKNLKKLLEFSPDKDIEVLSSDYDTNKLTMEQTRLILDVATSLYGKLTFTEEQITPYLVQAGTWFVLEKLRREGLITIDDKGVPHRTQLGEQVNEELKENEKTV